MATGYNLLLRQAQLDAITTFAGALATLRVYSGVQPATGGAVTTLLAQFTLGSPYAPASSAATLSPTLPANVNAGATGTATWFRVYKADGTTQVIDGTCGTTGTDMILNTTSLVSGNPVSVTAWTVTRGNA